jgi:nucleoside-diphosphate-sugar epimerase
MKVLILGGTGVISREIVQELLRHNNEVTIVTRGQRPVQAGTNVEALRYDRHDTGGLAGALSGRRFDAVIDMICFDQSDASETVALFRDHTDHLVVVSSVAAYHRPYRSIPTSEDQEVLCSDPEFAYAFRKAQMENELDRSIKTGVPITIVRPSLTYGDGARNVGVLRQNAGILSRIREGKPLVMFGDGTVPWSFSFAPDVARGLVGLLGKSDVMGKSFHIVSQERTLWRDLYLEFGRIVGREPVFEYVPTLSLFRALPDLCGHLYYEKSFPGLFDDSKLKRVLPDFQCEVTLADGLRSLVESWLRDGLETDAAKDELEDRIVAAARAGSQLLIDAMSDMA